MCIAINRKLYQDITFFIEVWLIYNVVLISAVQQSDSVIHIYTFFFVFLFFLFLFIYLFLAVLGLRFCARAFSSRGKRGPLFIAVRGPLLLRSTGSRCADSVVVAHGLSCSAACGMFPDQGSNPCPLALAGRFSTAAPPGKPLFYFF